MIWTKQRVHQCFAELIKVFKVELELHQGAGLPVYICIKRVVK